MSESEQPNLGSKLSYVAEALQLDPVFDSERIVSIRTAALGLIAANDSAADSHAQSIHRERRLLNDMIKTLRAHFWEMPIEDIDFAVTQLTLADYPDVRKLGERFKVLASGRDKLLRLVDQSKIDANLFRWLKTIFARPPGEVTTFRKYVEQSFRHPLQRRRLRKCIAAMEHELPAVFALEEEWFELLRRQRMSLIPFASVPSAPKQQTSTTQVPGWVLFVILIILSNLMRAFFQNR